MARRKSPTPTVKGKARAELAKSLRRKYEAGRSLKDIAEDISASDSYVYVLLVEVGTVMRPTPIAPLGSAERAELAQMMRDGYEVGLSQSAVARSIGCDHDTARRLIVEAGGTIRTEIVAGLADHARPLLAKRLRIEYENGAGLAELSAELRCRESSVGCLLLEAGATLRPDHKIADAQRYPAQPTDGMGVREFADLLGWQPPPPRRASRAMSPQDSEQIAARYRNGDTIEALASSTDYPYSAVRKTLLDVGVELRPCHVRALTREEVERVVAQYQAGETVRSLAASTGCAYTTIRKAILDAGVELRPRGVRALTTEQAEDVVARYQAGESMRSLAASTGCRDTSIRNILVAAGAQIRRPGGRSERGGLAQGERK